MKDIDVFELNLKLKRKFGQKDLDPFQMLTPCPYDLDLENRKLLALLSFTKKYLEHRSRDLMEIAGMPWPPIDVGWNPDYDWEVYERWLNGEPIKEEGRDFLKDGFEPKAPQDLETDEEAVVELLKLKEALTMDFDIGFRENELPPLVEYMIRHDLLSEDIMGAGMEGHINFDHCSGYCPGCEIRPWCDPGQEICWPEDEKAGKMVFSENLNRSVSASPQSLQLLIENDRDYKENRETKYEQNQDGTNPMNYVGPFGANEPTEGLPTNMN